MIFEKGDRVKVTCLDRSRFDSNPEAIKTVTGTLKSVFNAFDNEGDNWFYEVRVEPQGWFLYKPRIDGGEIILLQKAK